MSLKLDIKRLKTVKKLLYIDKYSIKGVAEYLIKNFERENNAPKKVAIRDLWYSIKKDIKNLKKMIDK